MKLPQATSVYLIFVVFSVSAGCLAEDAIPLVSDNFTVITDNCAGNYTLIEHIHGGDISSDHFPLCSDSNQPFSGRLYHGGGYRFLNLNIDKPGDLAFAAMFGYIDGASIDVIAQNSTARGSLAATIAIEVRSNNRVNVEFYDGGVVTGEYGAAMMALYVTGDGNSLVQINGNNGTLAVEVTQADRLAGGFLISVDGDHNHFEQRGGNIDVKATASGTYVGGNIVLLTGSHNSVIQDGVRLTALGTYVGGGICRLEDGAAYNTMTQTDSSMNVTGTLRCAGAIQDIFLSPHNSIVQTHIQMEVTGSDYAAGGGLNIAGLSVNNTLVQTDSQINVTLTNPSGGVASGGFYLNAFAPNNTVIQTGNRINIFGTGLVAIAFTSKVTSSNDTQLLLFSGGHSAGGSTPACSADVAAATGLIDVAGYNVDAQTCFSLGVTELNSTLPNHWHIAQQEFCNLSSYARGCPEGQETSCHYPHEQLQTVAHAGNDSLWLVTRQRYPFNPDSDRISPVRVSRFLVNDTAIQIDDTFNNNSALILPPNPLNTDALPDAQPVAQIQDPDWLTLFYPSEDDESLILARFPLSEETGNHSATYDTQIFTGLNGQPVLLNIEEDNSYSLWMREQDEQSDIVRRYRLDYPSLDPVFEVEYDLNNSAYPNALIIGLGADSEWLYIARYDNTEVVVERISQVSSQLEEWPGELADVPVSVNSEGLVYRLLPEDNRLYFMPIPADVPLSESSVKPVAFNVEVPGFGGCPEWTNLPHLSFVLHELPSLSLLSFVLHGLPGSAMPTPTTSLASSSPVPVTSSPVPVISSSVPVNSSPAPVTSRPVPVNSSPVPVNSSPALATSHPIPTLSRSTPAPSPSNPVNPENFASSATPQNPGHTAIIVGLLCGISVMMWRQ